MVPVVRCIIPGASDFKGKVSAWPVFSGFEAYISFVLSGITGVISSDGTFVDEELSGLCLNGGDILVRVASAFWI